MVEVNFRIFFQKNETELFPDYHRHLDLVRDELRGRVKAYLDRTDAMAVYQYYSISPLGCIESRYLRRMKIGKSVMYIKEGIREYADKYSESRHLPHIAQRMIIRYLKMYLNSLDYIVVASKTVEEKLKWEGVCIPRFYEIPAENQGKNKPDAVLWLELYQNMANVPAKESRADGI